jgi:uncharacterized membrane protein
MMGFSGVMEILLIAIILWAVIQFTKKYRSDNADTVFLKDQSADNKNALGMLKKRFASGEISQIEYDRMKKDIL